MPYLTPRRCARGDSRGLFGDEHARGAPKGVRRGVRVHVATGINDPLGAGGGAMSRTTETVLSAESASSSEAVLDQARIRLRCRRGRRSAKKSLVILPILAFFA